MKQFQDYVVHGLHPIADQVKGLTRSFHDFFDTQYFTWHSIDRQGRYAPIIDCVNWGELYLQEKFYETDPFLCPYEMHQSALIEWSSVGEDQHKERLSAASADYFGPCLSFIWVVDILPSLKEGDS